MKVQQMWPIMINRDFTAGKLVLENISKHKVKAKKMAGNIFLFNFKT